MLVVMVWMKACERECVAIVKRGREQRAKTDLDRVVHWCCDGCTLVLCILASFPLSVTLICHWFVLFCIVTMHHTGTHRVVVSICVFSLFLFLFLFLYSHAHTHTHTHCDTKPTSACVSLLLLLPLLLLLLLSLWCTQPGLQQHWCRRSSGDCRGAEEQQHAAEAGVSAVCVDLGWWMRLCLW